MTVEHLDRNPKLGMQLVKTHTPLLVVLVTMIVLGAAYAVWKHELANLSSFSDLSLKQKCSADGTVYFNNTLLPQDIPQTIARGNQELVQQYGQQAAEQGGLTESISFGNPKYAYSKKLNTCLISYIETAVLTTGTVANYYVTDIYSNKEILSYFEVNGKPGNAGNSYEDFATRRDAIMEQ